MAFADLVARIDRSVQRKLGDDSIIYQPDGGDPVPVTGVFDAAYVLVQGGANAGVESSAPAVFLILSDLPVNPEDDDPTLTIGGIDYRVAERRPDGKGGIVLVLRLAVP